LGQAREHLIAAEVGQVDVEQDQAARGVPAAGDPREIVSRLAEGVSRYRRFAMDMHPGEDVVFEGHPSWRALLSFYVYGTVAVAVVGVIVALVASVAVGVLTAVVLFAIMIVVGFVKRMATTYMVTNQRLYIRRGILSKAEQQTRIDRVQNVNTNQTLLQRMLSVGTVDFDTAGTDDSEFRFVGIADPGSVVHFVDKAQREAAEQHAG
jgi:membrane protein YdbS with pleckstrin-like domain